MGEILRAERDAGAQHSDMIAAMIRNGEFVPKELTVALLQQTIEENPNKRGYLIDGFPRALDQAAYFEDQVAECRFMLFIDCPENVMEKRLLSRGKTSGRVDDNLETIRKRIRKFKDDTLPLIQHYKELGKVRTVSGTGSVDEVYAEIRPLFQVVPEDVIDISKMQSILDMDPIYTAEQIVIPDALPSVLREWSKAVLRAQPADLLVYSAEYFSKLADETPLELTVEQLTHLQRTLSTALDDIITRTDIKRACKDVGIESSVVDHVFRLRKFGQQVDWPAFVVFATALIAEDLTHTVKMLFAVFGASAGERIDREIFLHLFDYLAQGDESIPNEALSELASRLKQACEGRSDQLVSFADYENAAANLIHSRL